MKIKAQIDHKFQDMEIHVCNNEMNGQVSELLEELNRLFGGQMIGVDEKGERCVLPQRGIIRFYAESSKILAQNDAGVYIIPKKLYELEKELDATVFLRISKSEIINIHKIRRVDMNMVGTIKVIMVDGTETYTSRRNVTRLKKVLEKGLL